MVAKPCACNRLLAALSMLRSSSTTATIVRLFSINVFGFRLTGKPSQAQIFRAHAHLWQNRRAAGPVLRGSAFGHSPRWTAQGPCEMQSTQTQQLVLEYTVAVALRTAGGAAYVRH